MDEWLTHVPSNRCVVAESDVSGTLCFLDAGVALSGTSEIGAGKRCAVIRARFRYRTDGRRSVSPRFDRFGIHVNASPPH